MSAALVCYYLKHLSRAFVFHAPITRFNQHKYVLYTSNNHSIQRFNPRSRNIGSWINRDQRVERHCRTRTQAHTPIPRPCFLDKSIGPDAESINKTNPSFTLASVNIRGSMPHCQSAATFAKIFPPPRDARTVTLIEWKTRLECRAEKSIWKREKGARGIPRNPVNHARALAAPWRYTGTRTRVWRIQARDGCCSLASLSLLRRIYGDTGARY